MQLNYHLTAPPTVEPVALSLAKSQLRLEQTFTEDDALIQAYISAARKFCEEITNRAFYPQTWILSLDHFPWFDFRDGTFRQTNRSDWPFYTDFWQGITINLPRPRCISVVSITYVDLTGNRVTLDPSTYYVDTTSEPARVVPQPGTYWPYTQQYIPGSVQVTFIAGSFVHQVQNEAIVVPAQAPYQVTLAQAANFIALSAVTSADGSTPIGGVSAAASGVLTFQAAQAGQSLLANYQAGNCPPTLVLAILQLVAAWYENREAISELNLKQAELMLGDILDTEKFYAFTLENN